MKRLISYGSLLAVLGLTSGCGNDSTTTPTTTTSPTTLTFASVLAVGGSTSRSFTTSTAGNVTVTLTSFGAGQAAGLGIGVPVSTVGGPCALTQSVVTVPGGSPQIVATTDMGTYCVQVYDIGNLSGDTGFSINIVYP